MEKMGEESEEVEGICGALVSDTDVRASTDIRHQKYYRKRAKNMGSERLFEVRRRAACCVWAPWPWGGAKTAPRA